jgi:hypothetical protein
MAKAKQADDAIHPIRVSKACWMYAEAKCLTVVMEERDEDDKYLGTFMRDIPWDMIEQALKQRPKKL